MPLKYSSKVVSEEENMLEVISVFGVRVLKTKLKTPHSERVIRLVTARGWFCHV